MHLAPRVALDPTGDFGAGPQPTIGWWLLESLLELCLLLWREEAGAPSIAMAAEAGALGTLVIVAMGQGANPRQAVPGDFSDRFGRLAPPPVARQFANGFAPLGLWPCGNVSRWLRCSNEL
jgi:hypothetical protein